MICGSGGSKSRLAKAAGAEPSGQMRDEKLHAIVAQSTFASEKAKTPHVRSAFGSCDVEKVQAVVARSTFPSQNVQSRHTILRPLLEVEMLKKCTPLWRKAVSKSTRTKHTTFRALLEVEMFKKCTPLWREAHFEVKMYKTPHVRAAFGR